MPGVNICFVKLAATILFLLWTGSALALEPVELVLLTNKNVPESRKLAEFYAASRKVPDHRILELDLPQVEEISFDTYENKVVSVVREFLATKELQGKINCLVTFYGVPLRIAPRVNTAADTAEAAALKAEHEAVIGQIKEIVKQAEAMALGLDPKFEAQKDETFPGLLARDTAARALIAQYAGKIKDPAEFQAFMDRAEKLVGPLIGIAMPVQRRLQAMAANAEHWTPEQRRQAEDMRDELLRMRASFDTLQAHRGDSASRAKLRALVKQQLGLFEYANLLEGMIEYLNTDATGAAFDSELALVDWNFYVRGKSLPNPLHFQMGRKDLPPIVMTCRLDAPEAQTVRNLISAGIKTEAEGLAGEAVVDAGGNLSIDSKSPAYAAFDQRLHALADFIRTKTKFHLTLDEKRDVLPKGSIKTPIAIYCGWYALQNYTQPGPFAPGAVGYHVASFELTDLHGGQSRQWCKGLLNDGIAATLGAVAEPYLNAFPPPEEFFPLLFTGKLTLAEVYWKTNPMISWQIAMLGDPLYNPFKSHPAVGVDALPEALQKAVKPMQRAAGH
jgi:uncharacterized protein (TIGR03790 family)